MPEIKFSRHEDTKARGRNGWFRPDSANVGHFIHEDIMWLDVKSNRWGSPAIQIHLTPDDMRKLAALIHEGLNEKTEVANG